MNHPDAGWVQWQRDHAAALAALQEAQRAYHRTVVGHAFAVGGQQSAVGGPSWTEGSSAVERQQESLREVDAARLRLDEVRARQPESRENR